MVKGDGPQMKVHYKGSDDDFVVFIEDAAALKAWKADHSIPLVEVVQSFDIFSTNKCEHLDADVLVLSFLGEHPVLASPMHSLVQHQALCMVYSVCHSGCGWCRQGAQGILDRASHASMDSEFGSHKEEEVVTKILESGEMQEGAVRFFVCCETCLDINKCLLANGVVSMTSLFQHCPATALRRLALMCTPRMQGTITLCSRSVVSFAQVHKQ
jgi:Shwachman-Bodian-Diamond syndrome (SBDS) protein